MRGDSNRRRRVAELLRRELATLIHHELNDPRAHGVTITAVDVSPDLSSAKVYLTTLAAPEAAKKSVVALNHAAEYLRHRLIERLVLRGVPHLRFRYDESIERGRVLTDLIERAVAENGGHKTE
ncbi:MAG: 30S ribosome-binding factor RbfA [Acidiferrobacterales bacterium]|nr:30S ribosome-binding factor RbfA [Acidiferrobacterales bacterium]